jgi:hypothetical protein
MNAEIKKRLDSAIESQRRGQDFDAFVYLHDAVTLLNDRGNDGAVERTTLKPLTLGELKRQVDAAVSEIDSHVKGLGCNFWFPGGEKEFVWAIGDFEIRRR